MIRNLLVMAVLVGLVGSMAGCDGAAGGLPVGKLVSDLRVPVAVTATDKPIVADGKLDEAGWKNAVALGGFVSNGSPAPAATRVLVTYDQVNLYVAVINEEPNTAGLVATAQGHDGNVWEDDSNELYIDSTNARQGTSGYCGFFLNSKNARYDRTEDESWDPKWQSGAMSIDGKAWVAEYAIPLKETLGVTLKPGHKMGLMLARNRKAGGKSETYYLLPCGEEAKDTESYAVLELK